MIKNLFLLFLLLTLECYASSSKASPITILLPKNSTLASELTTNVVLEVDPSKVDTLVLIAPLESHSFDLNLSKKIYCKSISLQYGSNRLAVRAYVDNSLIDERVVYIYVASPIHKGYKYPPREYKKQLFHTSEGEMLCKNCHDLSVNEEKGVAFLDVTESNCYLCHHKLNKYKYAHAPSINYLCTSCHRTENNSARSKEEAKYQLPQPVDKLCFGCHKKNFKAWRSSRYQHEPLDSGRCNRCHNSHSSPQKMFLRKSSNSICLGCHIVKRLKPKSTSTLCEGEDKHKVCVDCHTPHASNREFFLIEKKELPMAAGRKNE